MKSSNTAIIEPLNPADYFTLAMDEEIRQEGMPGNYACFGLNLTQSPDVAELQRRITEFSQRFPRAGASLQQRGKRFYWCQREQKAELFFHHQCPSEADEATFHKTTVDTVINQQLDRDQVTPIEFHLITGPCRNTFFIRWIHTFCDARGADLILKYLCTDDVADRQKYGTDESSLVDLQLAKYSLLQKIFQFVKAKRYIAKLDNYSSIMPFSTDQAPQQLNHHIYKLTPEQTAKTATLARKAVGLTGTSLYYIGCFMRALDSLSSERTGQAYCAPYAFNLRKQRALTPIAGNHLSALFAQAPREIVKNRSQLFKHLKEQNTQVIRQQLDYAILPLMWAGSWLSLDKYGKILRLSGASQQERSSFWFSDIGQLDIGNQQLAHAPIEDVFHACQMTTPPGLALLCCVFNKRLVLSYNFIEPCCDMAWIEQLHNRVLAELLTEDT
jgi:NRPS condensation-like uncharacterized protein